MRRETAMYRVLTDKNAVDAAFEKIAPSLQDECVKVGAKNASAWTVCEFVYLYAEFEDDGSGSLKDLTDAFAPEFRGILQTVAAPGTMRLMYHCIGNVRADKSLIRRRVFATVLKPDCAEEYFRRHQAVVDARGDEVIDGPETNFTIRCADSKYIFGYCELVKSYDHEPTEEEKASTVEWETRQLGIMDWLTDDVDWMTGDKHEKMRGLFLQKGF